MQQSANTDYDQQQQQYQQHSPEIVPTTQSWTVATKKLNKMANPAHQMTEGQQLGQKLAEAGQSHQPEKDRLSDEVNNMWHGANDAGQAECTQDPDRVKLKLKIPRAGMKRTKNTSQAGGQLHEINITKKIESLEKQLEHTQQLFNQQTAEMGNLQTSYAKLKEREQIYLDLTRNVVNLLVVQHKWPWLHNLEFLVHT